MKHAVSSVTLAVALMLSASVLLNAQNREKFIISATAGGVNTVSGRAELKAGREGEWTQLTVTDDLKAGDVVRTGRDGRVEMLLNPGSYLRVGEDSEFELTNNSLDNLEVRLIRGTAIIEATGAEDTELAINITTPHTKMVIVKRGLYRVSIVSVDTTELYVRKGRVLLADSHTKVKEGNKVVFSSTAFSVAKMGKADKQKDNLEVWSKARAETLALANRRVEQRSESLLMAGMDSFYYGFGPRSPGVWFFNSAYRCYTFLPFLFGWGSPYGASYSGVYFYGGYHCCGGFPSYPPGYRGPFENSPRSGTGSNGSTSTGGTTTTGGGNISRTPPSSPPSSSPQPARDPDSAPGRYRDKTPEPGRPIQPR
jgi:hypothetical protein